MASGTLVRRVMLQIGGDSADAEEKLDLIKAKAEELRELHPELTPRINTAEAQAKMRVLRDELKLTAAEEPVVDVNVNPAQARIDELKVQLDRLRLEKRGIVLDIDASPAEMKIAELQAQIDALNAEETKTAGKGEGLAKAWEVTKFALLGVGAALGYGIYKAAGFQAETTRLVTSAGELPRNLSMVRQGMLDLSSATATSTEQLSSGMYVVESAGFHGAAGLTVLKAAAQGAKDENADLATVANAVTDVLVDYHLKAGASATVTSQLVKAVSYGKTNFQEFSSAIANVAPLAAILHLKLSDVTGVLAEMTAHGMSAARASEDEANAMRELIKPNAAMTKEWTALGISAQQVDESLSKRGLGGTLEWLSGVAHRGAAAIGQNYTQALGKAVGTAPALQVALAVTGKNFGDTTKAIRGIGGATADAKGNVDGFAMVSQTLSFKLKQTEYAGEGLATQLGEGLLPAATKVMGWLSNFVQGLQHGSIAATGVAAAVGTVLAGIALKKLEDGLTGAVEGVEGLWKGGTKLVGWATQMAAKLGPMATAQEGATVATEGETAAQEGLNVAMDTNPIGLIILGIAALVIGFVELWKHCAGFRDFWKAAWRDIKIAFDDVWGFVKEHWQLILGILIGPVGAAAIFVVSHWRAILRGAEEMYHGVVSFFEALPGRIMSAVRGFDLLLLHAGEELIMGLINGIENSAMGAVHAVEGVGHDIMSGIKSVLGIFSPSREFYLIGAQITAGLASGIQMTSHQAVDEARRLGREIVAAAASGDITAAEAAQLSSKLGSAVSRQLVTDRAGILATIKKADAYANSVTSGVLNTYGLSQAAVSNTTPAPVSAIIAGLRADAQQARQFAAYIRKLGKEGLSKTYLDQLIQMGPDQGYAIAKELADANLGQIRQINSAERSIDASAVYLGHQAANAMYDTGKNAGKGFLSGLEGQERSINALMERVARNMVSTLRRELGIRSPSEVMREHGRMVGAGLALGITDSIYMVDAAVQRMAHSAAPGGAAATAGGRRPGVLQLEWVGGSADQALITLLKRHIRVKGGDPSVLGR